jgi:hypothetical protein
VHKAYGGATLIGVANKTSHLGCLWALPNYLKHNEAGFSTDWLCLRVAQISRSRDLAIFVLTTDDGHANRLLYPCCACVHTGNNDLQPDWSKCHNHGSGVGRGGGPLGARVPPPFVGAWAWLQLTLARLQ